MTYEEESYVLDTLKELQKKIRDMPSQEDISKELSDIKGIVSKNNFILKQNNKMLGFIVQALYNYIKNADNENNQDFGRNVLANLISNVVECNINNGHNI